MYLPDGKLQSNAAPEPTPTALTGGIKVNSSTARNPDQLSQLNLLDAAILLWRIDSLFKGIPHIRARSRPATKQWPGEDAIG